LVQIRCEDLDRHAALQLVQHFADGDGE
jgi:hypothetical protein